MKPINKTLKNGVKLIMVPMKDNPAVTVMALAKAGSTSETAQTNGIAHFLEHMAMKGGEKYKTPYDVSSSLDKLGAVSNAMTGHEFTGYYAKAHHKHFQKVLDVIGDVYISPRLDEAELEKERGVILEEINLNEDLPMRRVGDLYYRLMYEREVLGRPILGPRENIKAFTRDNFVDFHTANYGANNTVVCVAGEMDTKLVTREVERVFGVLKTNKPYRTPKVRVTQKKPRLHVEQKKTDQVHCMVGVHAYKADSAKMPALRVLNAVLGGGMSGRLFQKLREEMGVCYYVRSSVGAHSDVGSLAISAGVDTKRVIEVTDALMQECTRLKNEEVNARELKKAKEYVVGGMMLELETSDAVNEFYVDQEIEGIKKLRTPRQVAQDIRSVTARDVQKVAREIFTTDRLNMVMVGKVRDEAKLKKALKIA